MMIISKVIVIDEKSINTTPIEVIQIVLNDTKLLLMVVYSWWWQVSNCIHLERFH